MRGVKHFYSHFLIVLYSAVEHMVDVCLWLAVSKQIECAFGQPAVDQCLDTPIICEAGDFMPTRSYISCLLEILLW